MTLLVFSLTLPGVTLLSEGEMVNFIESNSYSFSLTIISFILVSFFWVYHHELIKIKSLNIPFLWINIFYLASISVIPFTMNMLSFYPKFFVTNLIFRINIFLVTLSFLIMYIYAGKKGFLEYYPSKSEKHYVANTFIMVLGITIGVTFFDMNTSQNFMFLFLLIPIITTIRELRYK